MGELVPVAAQATITTGVLAALRRFPRPAWVRLVATILGVEPSAGVKQISDEKIRGSLLDLFARSRLGWSTTVRNEIANADGKPLLYNLPVKVRDGDDVKTVPAGLTVFRILQKLVQE